MFATEDNQFDVYQDNKSEFVEYELGAGIPWRSQYGFNPSTLNDIRLWRNVNNLKVKTDRSSSLVTNSYIYILGGYSLRGFLNTIQRASFDSRGNLISRWSNVGALPIGMRNMGYVVAKGRYYLIGGFSEFGYLSTVYSAPINTNGALGTFRTERPLPTARTSTTCFVIKDKLYVVGGGSDSGYTNTVYRAIINEDGTLSSWETLPNFPINFTYGKPLLIKDRIYIFGAFDGKTSRIYYTTYDYNGDIGSWVYVSDMPQNIFVSSLVCSDYYVFSIGGYSNTNNQYTNATYRAPILPDGSIGAWAQISDGPVSAGFTQSAIIGNKIYLIGGYGNTGALDTVYSAVFDIWQY